MTLFGCLLKPDIILIDHGHFQYNSLILGLILSAFYFLINKNYYICCIFYTVAIHSKQMSVYYALAFFAGLIGKVIGDYRTNKAKIMAELLKFATIVLSVSLIIWLPFILTGSAHLVIEAIFPVHRGLYQLKVQNFWCISDTIMKW
jgi:alpha-1,3-glucosyltransferase